jgi:hypothetical protein
MFLSLQIDKLTRANRYQRRGLNGGDGTIRISMPQTAILIPDRPDDAFCRAAVVARCRWQAVIVHGNQDQDITGDSFLCVPSPQSTIEQIWTKVPVSSGLQGLHGILASP